MRNPGLIFKAAGGFASVIIAILFCYASLAADLPVDSKPAAVDAARYADFMANEVLDLQDLAEGADVQRRMFDRMTPPGFSWFQPMFPAVVPFVAANFDEPFLSALLGEDRNSVAVYPLALALNPKTRETLVYNVEEKLIATIPADKAFRYWPGDVDPARVTLQLDLLPMEDVEKYLYTEGRIAEIAGSASLGSAKISRKGGAAKRSLGASEFGICNIQHLTNGNFRLTVTNGDQTAEIFAYTVWHTSSVVVVTWTNEQSNVVTDTNTLWTPVSPPYNGWESEWDCLATNLLLTNGVGIWDNTSISSNARVRFYAAAHSADADGDRLTDGAEKFVYHTDPNEIDTDEDGLLDGFDIAIGIGDARYALWATNGIVYFENNGTRTFKGELTADTSPLNSDTDSDGLPDGWEVQNGLDATDANGNNGPDGDPDDDSFDNELELELGAPANNAAWNGNQLAYRLTHVHTVMVTNPLPATNQIGMRVDIEKSADCGGTAGTQNVTDDFNVPALLECGYYINITVEGSVEDVDTNYDMVSFEAYTNTPYFQGHYNRPKECRMVGDSAMRNILILANNSVHLRYDTVSYKWHSGAYCEITEATNTGPYRVVISGDDSICLGDPVSFSANGAAGPPYTWNGSGVSVGTNGEVTGLSPGFATVTASDSGGCTGEKKVLVLKPDIGTIANLADRTLHPGADRKPISLPQTLPSVWAGQMEFTISGALAYWAPTGGTPFTTAAFSNAQLPQTIYLEGDGCGTGNATFTIDGPPGCGTNTPIHVFGVNATLDGIIEQDEESPGGFIADSTTHTNAPRTLLTLDACGSAGSSGNLVLTWDSAVVRIYTAASGGSALAQVSIPFSGFNGTNLYVEGIAPGSNTISWGYSEQSECKDEILATVIRVDLEASKNLLTLKHDRDCNLEVKTTPAAEITVDEYRIDIKRTNSATWYVLSTNKTMTPWHGNIAGGFHLRGMAKVGGTESYSTNIVIVNQFPTYTQIEGDTDVRTATDAEWANTLTDCTENPNQRRERGFWIQINTTNNLYQHTTVVTGPWVGPTQGASVMPGNTPADIPVDPAPNATGAVYTVACFHTHTPTTYRPVGRPVGPSGPPGGDVQFHNNHQRVGVVYDYVGDASGVITNGCSEGATTQRYPVGPTQRPLP